MFQKYLKGGGRYKNMNKKIILSIALLTLLGLAIFVSASELKWGFTTTDTQVEEKSLNLIKGWNLIQGLADPSFIVAGTQGRVNSQGYVKAIFAFNPINKEYVRVYPNPERTSLDALPPSILQLPMWVYSSKGGESISYQTESLTGNFQFTWPAGWNFISISNEMVGKSLDEIKGTCNIEKAYMWDTPEISGGGRWEQIPSDGKFNRDFVGLGFVIKFTSECKLGTSADGIITPPPAIPNTAQCTDSDGGLNYYIQGTASGTTSEGDSGTASDGCGSYLANGIVTPTNTLTELYCENNILKEIKYNCSSGCQNGACI